MSNINPLDVRENMEPSQNVKTAKGLNILKSLRSLKSLKSLKNLRTKQDTLEEHVLDQMNLVCEKKPSPTSSLGLVQIPKKKQFYKTKMCPWYFSGKCDRKDDCLFAHSEEELNPIPDLSFTSLCPFTKKTGVCHNENCSYAHSVNELKPTGDLYKTAPCTKFMRGKCSAGPHCRHAHYLEELRPLPGDMSPSESAVSLMLSPIFTKMISQNENRKKSVSYARTSNISNKQMNVLNAGNRYTEEEKEPDLRQSKTIIGNISSVNSSKRSKKYVKDVDEIPSFQNSSNYKKSYSTPGQFLPDLIKSYKSSIYNANSNVSIGTNDNNQRNAENLYIFSKAGKNALNTQRKSNTGKLKQYMTNKNIGSLYYHKEEKPNESIDIEEGNNMCAKNVNLKKIVNMIKNNAHNKNLEVEHNVKAFVNELLKVTIEKKKQNYVNTEKNVERLNSPLAFTATKQAPLRTRIPNIPSSAMEEFLSQYAENTTNNNIQRTVKQAEVPIPENVSKDMEETTEKVDSADINALLTFMKLQKHNTFDQGCFFMDEEYNEEEYPAYKGVKGLNEEEVMKMETDKSLSFLQQTKQLSSNMKGKKLSFDANIPTRMGSKNIQQTSIKKKKKKQSI